MADARTPAIHERWALGAESERIAGCSWRHPGTGQRTRFGVSTIERWLYQAQHTAHPSWRVHQRPVGDVAGG